MGDNTSFPQVFGIGAGRDEQYVLDPPAPSIPISDPFNIWAPSTTVTVGHRIRSGTLVWECQTPGVTGIADPNALLSWTAHDYDTVVEAGGVAWTYVGIIGSPPVPIYNMGGAEGVAGAATAVVHRHFAETMTFGDVTSDGGSSIGQDGTALTIGVAYVGAPVAGHAEVRNYARAGAKFAGWTSRAAAANAYSDFDDGTGIGPNNTPPTAGMSLVADASGHPRWTIPVGATLSYVEQTSPVTCSGASEAAATAIVNAAAITLDGATTVEIEFQSASAGGGQFNTLVLYDGGSSIGLLGHIETISAPVRLSRRLTPAAGAHTYSIKGYKGGSGTFVVDGGAGGVGNVMPTFIHIKKV